jgi:hypothetical protein
MKILHFIPDMTNNNDMTIKYMSSLVRSMEATEEIHIITVRKDNANHIGNANIHYIQCPKSDLMRNFLMTFYIQPQFLDILCRVMPDIIHVHGCWDYLTYKIGQWSRRRGYNVVLSPENGFEPWNMKKNMWTEKMPKFLLYQYKEIKRASAVIVHNHLELQYMSKYVTSKHAEVIKNVMLTNSITYEEMARQYISLYQSLTDRFGYISKGQNVRKALCMLIRMGTMHNHEINEEEAKWCTNIVKDVTHQNWKRLFIYASDENITDIIERGIKRLGIELTEDYSKYISKSEDHDDDISILKRNKREKIESLLTTDMKTEKQLCRAIITIKKKLSMHKHTLRDIIDLYDMMRYNEYDEDALSDTLKAMRIYKFTARMEQIIGEIACLEEGFMPIPPLDDLKTEQIRQHILKHKNDTNENKLL